MNSNALFIFFKISIRNWLAKLVLVQTNIFVLLRNKRFDSSESLTALRKHINLKSILQQDIFQIISFAIVMYLNVKCQKLNLLIYNLGLMFIFLSFHFSIFASFCISFSKGCEKNSHVMKSFRSKLMVAVKSLISSTMSIYFMFFLLITFLKFQFP